MMLVGTMKSWERQDLTTWAQAGPGTVAAILVWMARLVVGDILSGLAPNRPGRTMWSQWTSVSSLGFTRGARDPALGWQLPDTRVEH